MWKGAISFGLITIPVKLYTATDSEAAVRFNMLHATDLSRIQMKTWCPVEDEAISRSDTVKGYEYASGKYVVITDEDLEKLPLKTMRTIEIEQFAPREAGIGPFGFTKGAYYVEPDKVGRRAFALLRQVLEGKGLTAVCKVVIREREQLAVLDPYEDTMMLTTLHWPDEIRSAADLDLGDDTFEFKPAELAMAEQLADAMTAEFDPTKFRDEYRDALMAVIEAKVAGQQVVEAPVAEEASSGNLVDLMKLLEASVKAQVDSRDGKAAAPVSLAEEKAAREAAPAKTAAKKATKAKAADDDAEAEEARPARRRRAS
ncbi:MAG: Ku protein [Chloroflexota bacterium]